MRYCVVFARKMVEWFFFIILFWLKKNIFFTDWNCQVQIFTESKLIFIKLFLNAGRSNSIALLA